MKSPREILFGRHQKAGGQLDQIRREVVAQLSPAKPAARRSVISAIWQELIWPSRRIWTGLAATWLVLAIVNVRLSNEGPIVRTHGLSTSEPVLMTWRDEDLLSDLTEPQERPEPPLPRTVVPRPRSDRGARISVV